MFVHELRSALGMTTTYVPLLVFASTLAALSGACSSGGDNSGTGGGSNSGGSIASASGGGGSGGAHSGSGGQAGTGPLATGGSDGATTAGVSAGGGAAGSAGGGGGGTAGGTAGGGGGTSGGAGGSTSGNTWTGTWAAASYSCPSKFDQRTIREIVHTSIGGSSARVRISNSQGAGPLQIRDVHLAQRTTGSSIDPASDKAVTFNGQPDVTVPAGMFAVSDGVGFVIKPLSDVAVSFYVVSSGGATCHQGAFQTNYSVGGNMVSSAALSGAQTEDGYYFLLNLDVMNPQAEGALVTLGASITDGHNSAKDANRRWPNDLAVRLVNGNRVIGVLNQGISGDGVKNAVNRFDRDVLSQPNVKWVIFSDNPINDLGGANRPTAQAEIDQIKTMIAKAHAKGVKFLCSTLTPFEPSEPARSAINDFIRAQGSGCDGIVDQDTATHDPAAPTHWRAAFNSGDNLHPNVAGLQAIADAVNLDLFK